MFLAKRKGTGIYYFYYTKQNGKRTCISTKCKKKPDAIKFISTFQQKLKWIEENEVLPCTIKEFRWQFLKYSESIYTNKTNKGYRTTFNFFLPFFGENTQLKDISSKNLIDYLQCRLRESSIYRARIDHINLSSAFNKAIQWGYLQENPFKGIKRLKLPEKQPNFYSKEDFNKLIEVIDSDDIRDLVIFDVNTGLRLGEICSLKFDHVNENSRLLILDNQSFLTKGKKVRTIPLNNNAFNVYINRKKVSNSSYIFTINNGKIDSDKFSKQFKKYIRAAKLNDRLNFHSLRHTFASWLIQKNVPIYNVSKLLGHADIKTTEIYSHLRIDDLKNSVDLI